MKLKGTLKKYVSNPHFNRLKTKDRQNPRVVSPELYPGDSNGQSSALSSTFFGKARAFTGRHSWRRCLN